MVFSALAAGGFEGCIVVVGAVDNAVDAEVEVVAVVVEEDEDEVGIEVVDVGVVVTGWVKVIVVVFPETTFPEDGAGAYRFPPMETLDTLNDIMPFVDWMTMLCGADELKVVPAIVTLHCAPCGSPDSAKTVLTVTGTVVETEVDTDVDVDVDELELRAWNDSPAPRLGALCG